MNINTPAKGPQPWDVVRTTLDHGQGDLSSIAYVTLETAMAAIGKPYPAVHAMGARLSGCGRGNAAAARCRVARVREARMKEALAVLQSLAFARPIAMWLFLLALPLIVLLPLVRLRGTSAVVRITIVGIRLVIAGLLVVALAEPSLRPAGHARAAQDRRVAG